MTTPELLPTSRKEMTESTVTDLASIRARATQMIVSAAAIIGTIIFFAAAYQSILSQNWIVLGVYVVIFAVLIGLAIFRSVPTQVRALILMLVIFGFGTIDLAQNGITGNSRIFYIGMVTLTTMLVGPRPGIFAIIAAAVTMIVFGAVGFINAPSTEPFKWLEWVTAIVSFALISAAIVIVLSLIINNLDRIYQQQRSLVDDLAQERSTLESRIEERTTDLQRRAGQLEVASQVAHDISQETNLDTLLSGSVELIRSKFDFYHASIFLIDDVQEFAVLRASTGEAGRSLLSQNHQLRIGAEGIVGYVTLRGEPRIALDVAEDAVHFKNPLLPDTRSEMAVPLRAGNQIIGALDVQSTQEKAFSTDDVKILQTVADQLAVGIQRATLLRKLDDTIQQMERGLQTYTRQAWRTRIRRSKSAIGFRSRRSQVEQVTDPDSLKAIKRGRGKKSSLNIPLQLRGTTLGMLQVQFESDQVPEETATLLRTVAERLTLALETARLLEEIQQRAEQERLIGDISARVRSSTDIQKILETTAQELGKSLGVDEVRIQLNTPAEQS